MDNVQIAAQANPSGTRPVELRLNFATWIREEMATISTNVNATIDNPRQRGESTRLNWYQSVKFVDCVMSYIIAV